MFYFYLTLFALNRIFWRKKIKKRDKNVRDGISLNNYSDLLQKELDKFITVQSLTQSIHETLKQDIPASIENSLRERGEVLREIVAIEQQVSDRLIFEGKDISFLFKHFGIELNRIRDIFITVQNLDKDIFKQLTNRKEQVIASMKELRLGQILPDHYHRHEHGGPSFVNIKE